MADDKQRAARARAARTRAARAETIGLLIVVAVLLLLAILRWGAHISWSPR